MKRHQYKRIIAICLVLVAVFNNLACDCRIITAGWDTLSSVKNAYKVAFAGDPLAQEELNKNQFIRNQYENWKTITLSEGYTFRIPEQWELVFDGDELFLKESDHVIARGWEYIGAADAGIKTKEDWLQDVLGFQPAKIESEQYWVHHTGQIGEYSKYIFENGDGELFVYYNLFLRGHEDYYTLYFGPLEKEGDDTLLEIIMAMAHSYTY